MARLDAHCHFWAPERGDYHWLDAGPATLDPLRRVFAPADLVALNGGGDVIAVQAAETVAETRYLLDVAAGNPQVLGVVGWVDLADPASATILRDLAANPKLRGVRPMLQDLAEADWIARRPSAPVVQMLLDLGLRFDALVLSRHLPALLSFARAWPGLPIVIDHCAKPQIDAAGNLPLDWCAGMAALAAMEGTHCKISGLLTELPPDLRTPDRAFPVLRQMMGMVLDLFGPSRLMWGSDWPVLTLAASHDAWQDVTDALLAGLGADERAAILGGTARRFYGVGGGDD